MRQVLVVGGFDDLRSGHIRFLQEAVRLGRLRVLLWSDETMRRREGNPPKFPAAERQYLLVTGCYDWVHSGHVRFFEEVAGLGDLYVVVGHDANVRALKGPRHPLFPEAERRYLVQSIRFVKQALVSTGRGWLDAEPEIRRIRPDIYAVNEDGDRPEKRAFCGFCWGQISTFNIWPAPRERGSPPLSRRLAAGRKFSAQSRCPRAAVTRSRRHSRLESRVNPESRDVTPRPVQLLLESRCRVGILLEIPVVSERLIL